MKNVICVLMLALCAGTVGASVPDWLLPDKGDTERAYPKITRGIDGTLVLTYVAIVGDSATVIVSTSSDDGSTWVSAGSPGRVAKSTLGLQRQPNTVRDNNGVMHCSWEALRPLASRLGIYHTVSTDNGATWSTPKVAFEDPFGGNQTFTSTAVGPDGAVYITYLSRDLLTDENKVMLVKSTDNGTTWTAPIRVDRFPLGGACDCCIQNIAVSNEGEVAVGFRSNLENRRDIWVSRSTDDGATFGDPILVQDQQWTIFGCPSSGPSLEYDAQGNLHFSWRDERDAREKSIVYYTRLNKGESMVAPNVALSEFADVGEYSDVSVDPTGMLVQVIYETSDGLFASQSIDGGKTFGTTELVDAEMGQAASAFATWTPTNGHVSAWQSPRDGGLFDVRLRNQVPSSVRPAREYSTQVTFADGQLIVRDADVDLVHVRMVDMQGRLITSQTLHGTHTMTLPQHRGVAAVQISDQFGRDVWRGVVLP